MTNETKEMERVEAGAAQCCAQENRQRRVYMPRADIYETAEGVVVLADMPGVDEKSVDITLENGVLTIHGRVEAPLPAGHRLVYEEYGVGDYRRAFTLSDEIDPSGIKAVVKNGVLKLTLPKAAQAQARRISVKSE